MEKPGKKLHFFSLNFFRTTKTQALCMYSVIVSCDKRRLTNKDIEKAKQPANKKFITALNSVSYLGKMTKEEFEGE